MSRAISLSYFNGSISFNSLFFQRNDILPIGCMELIQLASTYR